VFAANDKQTHNVIARGRDLGHDLGANWSLSRRGMSTGEWAEKDMDHARELAQSAKVAMPLGGLVDQLVKGINQERMKSLLG
jgi:3-hydroxyisobutyrate dehydrogenase-like beta-hydroxyacid dehydrogenase